MPRSSAPTSSLRCITLALALGTLSVPAGCAAPTMETPPDGSTPDVPGDDTTTDDPTMSTRPPTRDGTPLTPRFEPDDPDRDFFRMPWPSDHRVLADGTVDLTDFPGASHTLVQRYRDAIEGHVRGFSTMPVGYFEMDAHLGGAAIPTPAESVSADSPVQLVNVSPEGCGERVPVIIDMTEEDDAHINANVLRVAPVPGFVLRQDTEYAFVILDSFGREAGFYTAQPTEFYDALTAKSEGALADSLAPLAQCAPSAELPLEEIAIGSVFTTQDIIGESQRIRNTVMDPARVESPTVSGLASSDRYSSNGNYTSYEATFEAPIFQDGVSPYAEEGGGIHFDEGGHPIVQRWETVPMIITVPEGEGPFPVLLWIDGTGWSQWSHVRGGPVQRALGEGFAVASYMPQFHGSRATDGSDEQVSTYNAFNPTSGRNNFRQQMAETSYFIRVLREGIGASLPLNADDLVFGGQSQGAQNGAFVAAVEPEIETFALNGLSAYLSITIVERKDVTDFEALIKALFGIRGDLDPYYPLLQLAQLGADAVDPQNYVQAWYGHEGNPGGANVLVFNGLNDTTTHEIGMNALTIAGDFSILEPAGWDVDPYGVWDDKSMSLPAEGNRSAFDGSPLTIGTYLNPEQGHFTVFRDSFAQDLMVNFWVHPSVRE